MLCWKFGIKKNWFPLISETRLLLFQSNSQKNYYLLLVISYFLIIFVQSEKVLRRFVNVIVCQWYVQNGLQRTPILTVSSDLQMNPIFEKPHSEKQFSLKRLLYNNFSFRVADLMISSGIRIYNLKMYCIHDPLGHLT